MTLRLLCTLVATSLMCPLAAAQITGVSPFVGDASDDFSSLSGMPTHVQTADIFQGDVTVNNLTNGGSITITVWSQLGGDLVTARSNPLMVGQLGVLEWVFHTPVKKFGGYFENNSRFDDAILEFYDAQDQLIGTANATVPEAAQAWTWNGWESTTPIHRIVSRGNDVEFLEGFIWYDDMQIEFADPVTIPDSYKLFDGVEFGGGLSNLFSSDDQYFELDPSPTKNLLKQKVHLILQSTSPTATPAGFAFRLESGMTGGPSGDVIQSIELFNHNTNRPELVDARAVSNGDQSIEVTPGGDLSRFVHPVHNEITAEIKWIVNSFAGAGFTWSVDIDEAVWAITD